MSDNVRDELATELSAIGIRTEHVVRIIDYLLANLAERGMVVLGPDGEPLDVRPALRALRLIALDFADDLYDQPDSPAQHRQEAIAWLDARGIFGPLADACLAATEVEP